MLFLAGKAFPVEEVGRGSGDCAFDKEATSPSKAFKYANEAPRTSVRGMEMVLAQVSAQTSLIF